MTPLGVACMLLEHFYSEKGRLLHQFHKRNKSTDFEDEGGKETIATESPMLAMNPNGGESRTCDGWIYREHNTMNIQWYKVNVHKSAIFSKHATAG